MRVRRVRHQLFLPEDVSARLEVLAARPGASKSAILADAVTAWLNRRGASELEDRFSTRLDRLSMALGRVERDGHVLLESLALFIRYELMINAPLPEGDQAARAVGRDRFNAFVARVGDSLASGRRTFEYSTPVEPDEVAPS
jgi:predicted transcriptional regulator